MSSTKQFGFHTVLIPIMVVLVELILHVATWVSPQLQSLIFKYSRQPLLVESELLGHTGNRRHAHLDKKDYRNASLKREYDVIALGDSHTFGTSVAGKDA